MYTFDAASVGASCASTSHEQGDLEWEMNSSEEEVSFSLDETDAAVCS
jgi:hypothetical protein